MYAKNRKAGFTLIEIMIVVVIIGFIASLGGVMVVNQLKKAKKRIAQTAIDGPVSNALELYFTDNSNFPTTEQGLKALLTKPSGATNWDGPYLKKEQLDPWNNDYIYERPGKHGSDFDLSSVGPDGIAGNEDDIVSWQKDSTE